MQRERFFAAARDRGSVARPRPMAPVRGLGRLSADRGAELVAAVWCATEREAGKQLLASDAALVAETEPAI